MCILFSISLKFSSKITSCNHLDVGIPSTVKLAPRCKSSVFVEDSKRPHTFKISNNSVNSTNLSHIVVKKDVVHEHGMYIMNVHLYHRYEFKLKEKQANNANIQHIRRSILMQLLPA